MKEHRYFRLGSQLSRVPFMAHIDQKTIDELMLQSMILEAAPGEVLLLEGEDENHFLVLMKGSVEIITDGEVVATIATSGEILGEQALLHRRRSATVRAKERVFCLRVDGSFVDSLTEEQRLVYQAELYRFLADVLAQRLDSTSRRLAEMERALVEARADSAD
ncbi:MAG: cyclic nucleotide-binding domain-containing protein [Verrucomicrobiales bacterium]|nr:cyclic nucleotide-binding domain-containing protein [Verrucomicrobiae bacterium]